MSLQPQPDAKKKNHSDQRTVLGRVRSLIFDQSEGRLLLIIVLLSTYVHFQSPFFLTTNNLRVMSLSIAEDSLMVVGMTLLIVCGVFDLSIGATLALTGVVAAKLTTLGVPVPLAFATGIAAGGLIGLVNGMLVSYGKLDALIATLGMSFVIRGLTLVITGGFAISNLPDSYDVMGQGTLFGIPNTIVLMIAVVVLTGWLMRYSSLFRPIYYVGGNAEAAHLAGFNTARIRIAAFVTMGVLTGLAGVVISSRLGSAGPNFGVGTELRIIAAVIIGGASLTGGRGTIQGAMLGLILMALITNALILTSVPIYYQSLVTGLVLLLAMLLDRFQNYMRTSSV